MKVIMVMFDSLNRRLLPPYGCDWTRAPNFQRLADRSVTFNQSFVCSMPCMPARRDMHTGRPNFLHRGWGPLEPFDDSVPKMLSNQDISTHLISDHFHYWEVAGANYHCQYTTWQFMRGQEGDPWIGQVTAPPAGNALGQNAWEKQFHRQDRINRSFMQRPEDLSQARTFNAGLDFLRRNRDEDNWFLQIETFDPHEPFFSHRIYQDAYPEHYRGYDGPHFDWPAYEPVTQSPEEVEHVRYEYASLLNMCDSKLGDVLDLMDEQAMWDDTMLIVWTDHGYMLGEHEAWAKGWMPYYQEIAHTPFFVWDPRCAKSGETRDSLVQPSIDIGPTLLGFFEQERTPDMTGHDLETVIADDAVVREAAIFGHHGGQVNVTDGRYVYMRGPASAENTPLNEYTLMPAMPSLGINELQQGIELAEPFSFTKGCRTLRIQSRPMVFNMNSYSTCLYDLETDPRQQQPLDDAVVAERMCDHLVRLMQSCDAPPEEFERLGLQLPARKLQAARNPQPRRISN